MIARIGYSFTHQQEGAQVVDPLQLLADGISIAPRPSALSRREGCGYAKIDAEAGCYTDRYLDGEEDSLWD